MNHCCHSSEDIYIWITYKYQNCIFQDLPERLITYLLENPNKVDIYLDKKINVKTILDELAESYRNNRNINLLEEVIKIVEGKDESRT